MSWYYSNLSEGKYIKQANHVLDYSGPFMEDWVQTSGLYCHLVFMDILFHTCLDPILDSCVCVSPPSRRACWISTCHPCCLAWLLRYSGLSTPPSPCRSSSNSCPTVCPPNTTHTFTCHPYRCTCLFIYLFFIAFVYQTCPSTCSNVCECNGCV